MELKKSWIEKLEPMTLNECIPLGKSPKTSVYSAVFFNKEKLAGKKFRVKEDMTTGAKYVCRTL